MKLREVGQNVVAFAVSDNHFGKVTVNLTPSGIERYIGTRSFSFLHRYLFNIRISICYCDEIAKGTFYSVFGLGEKIKGPVLIFAYDGDIRSFTTFELEILRTSSSLFKFEGKNHLIIDGISREPRDIPFTLDDSTDLVR